MMNRCPGEEDDVDEGVYGQLTDEENPTSQELNRYLDRGRALRQTTRDSLSFAGFYGSSARERSSGQLAISSTVYPTRATNEG